MYIHKIIIVLALEFFSLISTAPAPVNNTITFANPIGQDKEKYSEYKNLLNESDLPFLKDCNYMANKGVCSLYHTMLVALKDSAFSAKPRVFTAEEIKIANSQAENKNFCNDLKTVVDKIQSSKVLAHLVNDTLLLQNPLSCTVACLSFSTQDYVTTEVKPICRILYLGFGAVQQNLELEKVTQENVSSNVGTAVNITNIDTKITQNVGSINSPNKAVAPDNKKPKSAIIVEPAEPKAKPHIPETEIKIILNTTTSGVLTQINDQSSKPNNQTSPNTNTKSVEEPTNEAQPKVIDLNPVPKTSDEPKDKPKTEIEENERTDTDIPDIFNQDTIQDESQADQGQDYPDDEDMPEESNIQSIEKKIQIKDQPEKSRDYHNDIEDPDRLFEDNDSNFFVYFLFMMFICIVSYVLYHNKTKVLALVLEGRRSSSTSGRGGLRRKHTAAYRKLDSNLEEAITSTHTNNRVTQIIY